MSITANNNSETMSTSLLGYNLSDDRTAMLSNESFNLDITTAILWYFYDKFHGETNYLLIILYVPVIVVAVTANVLVIAVVFKYHYMRRYVHKFYVHLRSREVVSHWRTRTNPLFAVILTGIA